MIKCTAGATMALVVGMLCSCTPPMDVETLPPEVSDAETFGNLAFEKSYPKLEQILGRRDHQEALPSFSLNPFAETQKSNAREIQDLVAQTLEILELSRVTELARQHEALSERIREDYDDIARHERQKITAPDDTPFYSLTKTKTEHAEAIDELRRDIAAAKASQQTLVSRIEGEFRAAGIDVSPQQVQFFLVSSSGENALALNAVFSNVKQINQQLADLIRRSGEDALTAKKYYGLHVVLIEILISGHTQSSRRIGQEYLPKVRELLAENQSNRTQTQTLLRSASDDSARASLQANLRAQDITDKAGRLYAQYLQRQQRRLDETAASLQGKYDVARNTYQTAKTASALVSLIKTSDDDLAALRGMELPEMVPFENAELQAKFEEIALRLKEGQ